MNTEKTFYERPLTAVIDLRTEGLLCGSNYMKFGSGNASGEINDEDVVDGGTF